MGSSILAQESTEKNIKTYCKVWGLCKYYGNTNNTDWDKVFFNHYKDLLTVKNNNKLNNILGQLIQQTHLKEQIIVETNIDSNFLISDFSRLKNKDKDLVLKTDFNWIFTTENIDKENKQLLALLLKTYKGKVPKTITIKNQVITHNKELIYKKFNNKIALLALLRFYNAIEYYYPYKHLLDNDWDNVLSKMIPIFLNCHNNDEYKNALKLFSSYLQDSHVGIDFEKNNISSNKVIRNVNKKFPIKFECIDHKLYISNVLNDSISNYYQIKIGNEISEVNGRSISFTSRIP